MAGRPNRRGWGWIRKLPSKRWQASYIGPDKARHTAPVTYTVKMDAAAWLSDERRLMERGDDWTPPATRAAVKKIKGVTVAEYSTTWLAQRNLKHRTAAHYTALLANHITPGLGTVELRHLTAATVRGWYFTERVSVDLGPDPVLVVSGPKSCGVGQKALVAP